MHEPYLTTLKRHLNHINHINHLRRIRIPLSDPLPSTVIQPKARQFFLLWRIWRGVPFSQLAFGSNEDVLRALQELDITKTASVLKTLGDAVANTNTP